MLVAIGLCQEAQAPKSLLVTPVVWWQESPAGPSSSCWQCRELGAVQALQSRADFSCVSFPKVEVFWATAGVQAIKVSHGCDISEAETPALGVQYFWFYAVW